MGTRELPRTNVASFVGLCVVFAITFGCGRALRNDRDVDSGNETGGSAGNAGSPEGGTPGSGGSSSQGGSAQGGTAQGGSSAEGGTVQGGSGGEGGEGGETATVSPHLFLQSANALLAVDLETNETIEVCPATSAPLRFTLVDWVDGRAIVHRQHLTTPAAGEFLRVALDGSECASLLLSESIVAPLSPVVGGRIVFSIIPMAMSTFEQAHPDDFALRRPTGLASIALDGTGLEVLAPNGLLGAWIIGERVGFLQSSLAAGGYELYTALPDASAVITPVPIAGPKNVALLAGRRMVVNADGDVYAVDVDGGNLAPLATGPDFANAVGVVGNRILISHTPDSSTSQRDLSSVDLRGGALTPIASSADDEFFAASIGERVIYQRDADLYSARPDGSDTLPITQTQGILETFAASNGERIVFSRANESPHAAYFSAALDGSDLVTLHENSTGLPAVVGDRAILYVGSPNYDIVSVPLAGGEPWLLADGAEPDFLVGRIDPMLVIQRGSPDVEGQVFRIDADGSRGALLAAPARYVGAVAEVCGSVRTGLSLRDCIEESME